MREKELEAHPYCANCGVAKATDIHHPFRISKGGPPFDPLNRVPLCGPCHRAEGIHPTFFYPWR